MCLHGNHSICLDRCKYWRMYLWLIFIVDLEHVTHFTWQISHMTHSSKIKCVWKEHCFWVQACFAQLYTFQDWFAFSSRPFLCSKLCLMSIIWIIDAGTLEPTYSCSICAFISSFWLHHILFLCHRPTRDDSPSVHWSPCLWTARPSTRAKVKMERPIW